jgi:glycosyltransferase involved in cell wall biosynthesis
VKPLEISIVLPVHNEVGNLIPLITEIRHHLILNFKRSFEIIAVDDGSTDGSDLELRGLARQFPELKVIFLRKNRGQSAAFDAGFQNAQGKLVLTMDADLQSDPKDILPLVEKITEGYDIVSGWRKDRKDPYFFRRLPSVFCNFLIRKVTRSRVHDLGCSLKIYRAEILGELRLYGEMHRFICPLLESMGAKIAEIEVNHRLRGRGQSKYGLGRAFKVLLDLVHVWYLQNYQTKPIYVFGGMGTFLSFTGALLGFYSLFERWEYGIRVHRNPLFVIAVTFFIIGFQMIGVGLIAELMIRTYFESQGKSPYSIREKINFNLPLSSSSIFEASAIQKSSVQ